MDDGPAHGAPGGVADYHGQGAAEADARLGRAAGVQAPFFILHNSTPLTAE